jgi:hypothetical protein
MASYSVLLRSDEAPTPRRLAYESDDDVYVGDFLVVEGMPVLVDDVVGDVLECRRLWKLRLVDPEGRPVGRGFILNEQRHYGDVETLVLDDERRYRVLRVEPRWPDGFDGAFVVEPL